MGSPNWGHQRKAVAIVITDAEKKSSLSVKNNFQLQSYPCIGQIMMMNVPTSVCSTLLRIPVLECYCMTCGSMSVSVQREPSLLTVLRAVN